jgi:hypothetical protein
MKSSFNCFHYTALKIVYCSQTVYSAATCMKNMENNKALVDTMDEDD